jgi:CPA1 family monovalent cation:H+ antiporter
VEVLLEIKVIWLLIIVTSVAMIVRKVKLPYTVALVMVGLVLGFFDIISGIHLTPDLLFFLLLPALLFEAAFHLDIGDFLRNAWAIVILAVPGVLVTMFIVGVIVAFGIEMTGTGLAFTMGTALLFGSLIAATDPISVLAIFKKLGISKKFTIIIEGESLFNDGTAVVVFSIALAALQGGELTLTDSLFRFFFVVTGGVAVGAILGFALSVLTAQVDDHLIEITLTTILAYGAYLVAESVHIFDMHFSGVIAVVVAGMMSGNFGTRYGMSPTTKLAVSSFWEYVVFVVNSMVFILIGIELSVAHLVDHIIPILIAWGAVLLSRVAVVYLTRPLVNRLGSDISPKWGWVLVWGGIRGSISMVLVLSLPKDFPHRELILSMTFGVVFLTLIGQGMSMRTFLNWLGLGFVSEERRTYERMRGGLMAVTRAMEELEGMRERRTISQENYELVHKDYTERMSIFEKKISDLHLERELLRYEEAYAARRHLLIVQKDTLKTLVLQGMVSEEAASELTRNLDAELHQLEEQEEERLQEES